MSVAAAPLSLNEVHFYFTRAAIGAGAPVGPAEDFGAAAVWLASAGLDPGPIAVPALRGLDAGTSATEIDLSRSGEGAELAAAGGGVLSAILAGPAASDWLRARTGGAAPRQDLLLRDVDCPLIVAAAAGCAGHDVDGCTVSWQATDGSDRAVVFAAGGAGTLAPEPSADLAAAPPSDVRVAPGARGGRISDFASARRRALEDGVAIDPAAWDVVRGCFVRCLVPSTAESLRAGAGAGLVDTD